VAPRVDLSEFDDPPPAPVDLAEFDDPPPAAPAAATAPEPTFGDKAKTFLVGEGGTVIDRLNAPVRAAAQVVTGGYADEITGAVGAGLGKLAEAVGLSEPEPFTHRYARIKKEYQAADDAGARANPVGSLGGTLAGAALPVNALAGVTSKVVPIVAGLAAGFGGSRGDLTTPEGRVEAAKDTAQGGAFGWLTSRLQSHLQRLRTPAPAKAPPAEPPASPPPIPDDIRPATTGPLPPSLRPSAEGWKRQAGRPQIVPDEPAPAARPAAQPPPIPADAQPRPLIVKDPKTGRFLSLKDPRAKKALKAQQAAEPPAPAAKDELKEIIRADQAAGATSIPEADRSTVEALRNVVSSQSRAGKLANQVHYPDPPDQAFSRYLNELPQSAGGTAAQQREALKALTVGRYKGTEDVGLLVYRARAAGVPDEQIMKAAGFRPGKPAAAPTAPAAPATPRPGPAAAPPATPRVPTSDDDLEQLLRQSVGLGEGKGR
jgi:hypothetical protein